MDDLEQLAQRVEAASGPSFQLEQVIGAAVFPKRADPYPAYTASLDAAAMLVPSAFYWSAGTIAQDGYEHYEDMDFGWAQVVDRQSCEHFDCEHAATPALALTAAALRARAQMEGKE